MAFTVYILQCADGSYYTGVTNDIDRRFREHVHGAHPKSFTFKRRPLELVFEEHFDNPSNAIAFEKQVKGWRREKKEALIKQEWDKLPELSVSKSRQTSICPSGPKEHSSTSSE